MDEQKEKQKTRRYETVIERKSLKYQPFLKLFRSRQFDGCVRLLKVRLVTPYSFSRQPAVVSCHQSCYFSVTDRQTCQFVLYERTLTTARRRKFYYLPNFIPFSPFAPWSRVLFRSFVSLLSDLFRLEGINSILAVLTCEKVIIYVRK